MRLTVVGLGLGVWESLTAKAIATLHDASEVYAFATHDLESIHSHLPDTAVRALHTEDNARDIAGSLEREAEQIVDLARGGGAAVFAVPGTPLEGGLSLRLALQRLERSGNEAHLVHGVSLSNSLPAEWPDGRWVEKLDGAQVALLGQENALGEVPGLAARLPWRAPVPTATLLITGARTAWMESIARWLGRFYPPEHTVLLVSGAHTSAGRRDEIPLSELGKTVVADAYSVLAISPLAEMNNRRTFSGLMELTRTLRAPGGCPWDREQTHASLKPHLLEEAYEVIDALDSGDPELIAEEMGDLLYQIAIHSQVAAEHGTFAIEDVISNIMSKLIGRHPHVFSDLELESAQDVLHVWESFKQKEKPARSSILEQIPRGLPALPQSNLMQKRAANVGFEWPSYREVIAKVEEELSELQEEVEEQAPREAQREEFGDILFALVSLARHLKLDPEEALRTANRKFAARFSLVESQASASGRVLRDLSPEELDGLWERAKQQTLSH
ncbi:MAG TPA: nucleoside triphosphate pyrophosphohydrolase [Chloroflexota bacterium]